MRREQFEPDIEPLLENNNQEREQWNLFKNTPRPTVTGSTAESKYIDISVKILKFITIIVTFLVVLGTAVISKATLLFMTSQIKPSITRLYCNKYLDKRQQYIVNLPEEERVVWIWLIIISYMVPELGTFVRSIRILSFKSWKYPSTFDFITLGLTEILPTIGSAILVFVIFPEMDVIKAAMLTNGVCLIPAIINLLSREKILINSKIRFVLDILAIIIQASALVIWPMVEGKLVLMAIPVSLTLISVGWWQNFVTDKSSIKFISNMGKTRKEFLTDTYFIYAIIAPIKCIIFFIGVLVILWIKEGDVMFLFNKLPKAITNHPFNVTQIEPIVGNSGINYTDAIADIVPIRMEASFWTPILTFLINIVSTYMCYAFSKFACKIKIQATGFALPINMAVPVLLTGLISMCGMYNRNECAYVDSIPAYLFFNTPSLTYLEDFVGHQYAWIWLIWLLSQTWITLHNWSNNHDKLVSTEKLFFKPMYDAFLIDQSVAMNRRKQQESLIKLITAHNPEDISTDSDQITKIYACGTMWHETKEEMVEFLKSVLRMDEDQCAHRIVRSYLQYNMPDYYEYETHIFFDDAFIRVSQDDQDPHVNQYVLDLVDSVNDAASKVHAVNVKIQPPVVYPTPYGGRLIWTLPGKTKMIAHLKDKAKIRSKKRWSQVMYMYYLLGFKIMDNEELTPKQIKNMAKNTYILALDGDIDFQPAAVHLLVEYMKKNPTLGAACGRIHPIGSGAMAWYQVFEYAVGHWLQKATEHVIGCVLCSPGCFSLFRAGALMDDNVMAKYTTEATEARHFVQYDQGEDRWLCTLLLQRGYRVEYSAASDAYTHCPEGFNEFYNQRRRWMPSTTANILDLLTDYKYIVSVNDNISKLYILYQVVLMIGTVIGPGTIFLMLVGAFIAAFKISQFYSLVLNIIPVLLFIIICASCKSDTQLFFAAMISAIYGLIMMTVFVGIMIQIEDDGWLAPSSLFLIATGGTFIIAALLHPQEFYCLKYGIIYYVTVPSMYMLLVIYSIFNMNNVSWGTREVTVIAKPKEDNKKGDKPNPEPASKPPENKVLSFFGKPNDNTGSLEFSIGGLVKLMCCTYDNKGEEREILRNIQTSIQQLQQKIDILEKTRVTGDTERRRTTRGTEFFTGNRATRTSITSGIIQPSAPYLDGDAKNENDEDDDIDESDGESIETPSDGVEANSWYYDGELINSPVDYINNSEKKFFEKLIQKYLYPLDETSKKAIVEKELKDLRDRMVITFFMLNSLFVLVIYLLNLQQDIIHINWPISPKVNYTYIESQKEFIIQKTYLQLQPIGFVFLIAFASLMLVQFIAMFIHRFGTYCQIMANTAIDFSIFGFDKVKNITEESLLDNDPIKIFKKLIRLQGINDEDKEENVSVGKRNTIHWLAMKRGKKAAPCINNLDEAFFKRMSLIKKGQLKDTQVPRPTIQQILERNRKSTILGPGSRPAPKDFGNNVPNDGMHFSEPSMIILDDTMTSTDT
ncbi:chitin synthase chs-2-like [Diorhabda carinulata]|uniref:chitin synthase chs-2-like n=1 Tax=Diorhabda carinulata TaxID=1163345 RepID=UPI0025A19E6B|nr:chitin synthase chs-2-like [Diorhabda carinulata]